MKIRILTHHSVFNHGALLQLYSLKKVLEKYDESVCALDYKKNYDFMAEFADLKYNISLKSIPFYMKYLCSKGAGRTLFNIRKKRILDRFKEENALVGEYYSRCKEMDAVFVGSDEVFSIEPGLNPFFWGMGVPVKHIFAYAGCFGPTDMDFIRTMYAEEYIRAGIARFDEISVRDTNSGDIISQMSGKNPKQVCDPVILYRFLNEKKNFKRAIKDRYLLVYAYDENMNNPEETKFICDYAKKENLKIVSAGFFHGWCDKCVNVTPIQLLQWINSAECVVTDTFHGTVMAMIMNTPFATKIRKNRNKLGNLLKDYGLEEREIKDFFSLDDILRNKVDFDSVNTIIDQKQKQGKDYIDMCIRKIEDDK